MEREKLISKLNIKDYNNQLEKILSKKKYTEDTKNLLLSMLYRVENAYNDYHKVNVDTKTKKEILEEILKIIENDCDIIQIVKEKKSESIKAEKKMITYLNEKRILYELYHLKNETFTIPEKYVMIKPSLEKALNEAYSIANSEIIRDFDGWSWNIAIEEIGNITANLLYQSLKLLVGNQFLIDWQENKTKKDYIEELIEKLQITYKESFGETLLKNIYQIAIISYITINNNERARLIKMQNDLQIEYDEINDKEKYIKNLVNTKRKITAEIKKIDQLVNDDKLLKKEFIIRNEVLDMNHRIFSLSDFVDNLQNERADLIKKLNICSKKMEPITFIKYKTDLENNLNLLKELGLEQNDTQIYNIKIKEFLKNICKAIKIQIDNATEENIKEVMYKIRYFALIYVNKNEQIKDIIDLNIIQNAVITKACKLKVIEIFSKNIKENYDIVKNIFKIDIIELEKVYFKITIKEGKTVLEIYDENNVYQVIELQPVNELNVKLGKKNKVII